MPYTGAHAVAYSIKIDRQKRLVISTFTGTFTPNALGEGRRVLAEDPDFDPSFGHIIDLSRVTSVEFPSTAVHTTIQESSIFSDDAIQVVIAPDRIKFEFAKVFKDRASKQRPGLQVTRTMEAALAVIAHTRALNKG